MKLVTTPENAERLAKLQAFFRELGDGEEASWLRVEHDTGIKMDALGKDLARHAMKREKRPYESIRGVGVRMSHHEAVGRIMIRRLKRIDGAVTNADQEQRSLQTRHLEQMASGAQQKMLMLASFFGAIRTIAKQANTQLKLT